MYLIRIAFILLAATGAYAGEYVLLANGSTLHVERHEQVGAVVRLFSKSGFTEIPAAEIAGFEPDVSAAPAPAPEKPPSPLPVKSPKPLNPQEMVDQAADKHGIPANLVHLVARAESAYQPNAISPKGAVGIMQLMPGTAAALGADPHDPAQNVEAGTRLLRDLLEKYEAYPDQLRRALAAYNAGTGAVERYNGVPPYRETQSYVEKIVQQYKKELGR